MKRQGKYTKQVTAGQQLKRHTRRRFRWWHNLSWKKRILYIGTPILTFLILTPLLTYLYFARDISDQDRLMNRNNTGVVLYANDGKTEIYSTGKAEHRDLVPLDQISDNMKNALLASEDKDFYKHGGFSLFSIVGAVYANIVTGGSNYGGSTITQQLAKNTLLTEQKSFLRKFQELSVSIAIEHTYSKDQILDMYLNSVFFGGNVFGIQDAAKTYFNKTPADLTLGESAMLVGILPAPNAYSPLYGSMEYAKERQATVLTRMVDNGVITEAQKTAAIAESLPLQAVTETASTSKAPHFTEMVIDELNNKYGEEAVARSGYQVTTTLDMNTQTQLQAAVDANMSTIRKNGGSNASAVAIDPTSGQIRGLIGSYDWNDTNYGKVNMVTTARQPGSSFKPIYYSKALADGTITPATILKDVKTDFNGYTPLNADKKFRGNVTARQALDWSLNIPAVEVLQKVGVSTAVETANTMGITSIDASKEYGLSLALGSAEAPLLQMTNAYAAFANQGMQYATSTIKSINNKYSDKIYSSDPTSKQVISAQGAFLISNILSDNTTRASMFGTTLNVYDGTTKKVKTVAVKTGTTDDSRDAWTIGYTPQLAVGVWVGNNDNAVMDYGGSTMAGPIFTKAMGNILAGVDTSFPTADGIVQKNVVRSSGCVTESTTGYKEYFLSTALPSSCGTTTQSATTSTKPEEEPDTTTPTQTSLSVSATPSATTYGQTVVITATVSSTAVSGKVTFTDDSTTLGTQYIANGVATLSTGALAVGTHSITATFTPDDSSSYSSSLGSVSVVVTASGASTGPSNNN